MKLISLNTPSELKKEAPQGITAEPHSDKDYFLWDATIVYEYLYHTFSHLLSFLFYFIYDKTSCLFVYDEALTL